MSFFGTNLGNVATETILLNSIKNIIPGFSEATVVSIQLNYTLTGGTFSISVLSGTLAGFPAENAVFTLPFGRVGVVKSVTKGYSTGGLVDTISGQALVPTATLQDSFTSQPGILVSLAQAAGSFIIGASWQTQSYQIKNFTFRGIVLSGIQQLASYLLAEVIARSGGLFVVDPGAFPSGSTQFTVLKSDIVSVSQTIDYSLDQASILNPALSAAQFLDEGDFIYDSEHAQKQPKTTVAAGAPGAQGSTDFIPIPDGWLVDGNFEEWTPPTNIDKTNPTPTPTNGRYWKVFQSPTNPGMMRGITSFTRLVKQINIPKNVSTFIGSPITGLTQSNVGGIANFAFNSPGVESGIVGFNAEETQLFDVISNQFLDIKNALVLIPADVVDTGFAASNFYTITMEMWTFPKVSPTVFPEQQANPFNIPRGVAVVTPNSNVFNGLATGYFAKYLANYKLTNSPRLRTTVTAVYRNNIPQPGDSLEVLGVQYQGCGRISGVSINFGRSGITLNITAEQYQFTSGLWSSV